MVGFVKSQKGLISVTFGNLLSASLIGIFWLLLASIQTVEEYGKTNYLIAMASLFASAALLGLNTTLLKFIPKGLKKINIQANQLVLISGGIAAIMASMVDWILGFFVIGMAFWMMTIYELLGKKQYKQYSIVMIASRASKFVIAIGFYYLFGVPGIVLGFAIGYLVFSYRYFISIKKFSFNFDEVKSKMKFSSHAYSFNMSNAIFMFLDKLIILPLFGFATLGFYQLGFQFLLFIGMIPISFYQYLIPEESSGINKPRLRIFGFVVSISLMVIVFLSSPWILETFFPHFAASIDGFRIMSLGIVPMMIVWILNSKFLIQGKTKYVVIGSAIYVSMQISLFFYLGEMLGVLGLAIAVVSALSLQAGFLYGVVKYFRMGF